MSREHHPDKRGFDICTTLLGPIFGAFAVAVGIMLVRTDAATETYWQFFRLGSSAYGIGLAISILIDTEAGALSSARRLTIAIALIGLAFATAIVAVRFGQWDSLRDALFLAVPSASILLRSRSDGQCSITLAAMALVQLREPFVYSVPPYVSLSILLLVIALYYGVRGKLPNTGSYGRITSQWLAAALSLGISAVAFVAAWHLRSLAGMIIATLAILTFGGLVVLRILLGDYWWVHRKT